MTGDKITIAESLIKAIPGLTAGQLHWLNRIVNVFSADYNFELKQSDLFDSTTLQNFGDAMRVHHSFSAEPFSKDKFEYVLVKVLSMSGYKASLAPKGNPGHDATVEDVRLSLKTQANKGINPDFIWISKFMELGKGQWSDRLEDLNGLRNQFFAHMKSYDKIFVLRALSKAPYWKYELVEIPKVLLKKAQNARLEMMMESKQLPKPGYCHVLDKNGETFFDLYFDGGSERKLQVKNLSKKQCNVYATWNFFIPEET